MERITLPAELRRNTSKSERKQLRKQGRVPAVIYGRGKDTLSLAVEERKVQQILSSQGSNVLVDLKIQGAGKGSQTETVMFKEIQRQLLSQDRIMHIDFIRISLTEKVEVEVPLLFTGDSPGVKEGGVLQILLRELSIRCLPTEIPEHVEVDLSSLEMGGSIEAGSLSLPPGAELVTAPEEPVVQVLAPSAAEEEAVEEKAEPEEAEEGPGETEEES
ncbi:MAG TPA: 50S ribosomal protein L25 [Bacillota bacterium]|jgi:large subunit ribosomal protein L25|nr:50S ribosomal protein L25 [Bacillota bacterium]HOB86121.1 50S ribosomal protein L25 [Bacillota bacterium]HOP69866.1 50S ribosomal protein L25 [Bacillota bacterium]HPT34590.1 50S ribosomal protein L25 [Bacillota bacterium]HPZ64138.1 50S ribosomal protein L25 [Bacillota bacterium]